MSDFTREIETFRAIVLADLRAMTQVEWAARYGQGVISTTTLSKILHGQPKRPSPATMDAIRAVNRRAAGPEARLPEPAPAAARADASLPTFVSSSDQALAAAVNDHFQRQYGLLHTLLQRVDELADASAALTQDVAALKRRVEGLERRKVDRPPEARVAGHRRR